jgi:hypothetical protein
VSERVKGKEREKGTKLTKVEKVREKRTKWTVKECAENAAKVSTRNTKWKYKHKHINANTALTCHVYYNALLLSSII